LRVGVGRSCCCCDLSAIKPRARFLLEWPV
jgi:hypothetical protein